MPRFLAAALLVGAAWAGPAAAATFEFRCASTPDEIYSGLGELVLADADADGFRRITGIGDSVRFSYPGVEQDRWAIRELGDDDRRRRAPSPSQDAHGLRLSYQPAPGRFR